jgi:signal transduction histidine kinase/CheY-like chemotaxis protein
MDPEMGEDRRLEDQVNRLRRQQGAIVALARRQQSLAGDLEAALREVTWVAAVTLRVRRSSVWVLTDDRRRLECLALYELDKDQHSSGEVLQASDYPRYFAALETGLAIDAHDAREDPRTSEFRDGYLDPLGITSMMDAAIRDEGRVIGVVCQEHVGPPREWSPDEVGFAGAVADQAALALAASTRHRLEAERDHIQSQLLHVQKLESLGVLAGGVAHDFNNLLTIIRTNVGVAKCAVEDDHPAFKPLDAAIAAADRAAGLTRQLLAYSGSGPVVVEPVDLGAQVQQIVDLVAVSVAGDVTIEVFRPKAELPTIHADASQIQQLAMNLVLNAAEAVGDGPGYVRVSVGKTVLDDDDRRGLLFAEGLRSGRAVILEVSDDGPGIDRELVLQIFDPFFTTKGAGRGLGLASVAGIVRGHGAGLAVRSAPGEGTTFEVMFPAAEPSARIASRPPPPAGGMVLVIDDEPAIASVAQQILADAGYAVAAANAVRDGIALFARYSTQVCAVLVDLRMPEMTGIEVLGELRRLRPDVPAVLMSAWEGEPANEKYADQGLAGFLQKPFTAEELLSRVASAVAGPPGG